MHRGEMGNWHVAGVEEGQGLHRRRGMWACAASARTRSSCPMTPPSGYRTHSYECAVLRLEGVAIVLALVNIIFKSCYIQRACCHVGRTPEFGTPTPAETSSKQFFRSKDSNVLHTLIARCASAADHEQSSNSWSWSTVMDTSNARHHPSSRGSICELGRGRGSSPLLPPSPRHLPC
jgi:hypothetical protein